MSKPFLSVIMPVYNVEPYLPKSIESVLNQTFADFELILVDDCSPDNSGAICDAYAEKDKRIRVVHKEKNQGLGPARNTGIDYTNGEYVFFMDSDDTVDNNLFEEVVKSLDINKAQVVVFGLVEDYFDSHGNLCEVKKVRCRTEYLENKASVRNRIAALEKETLYGYAWNKFYNLKYLKENNFLFTSKTLIEDIVFNVAFFDEVERVNILDITPYHYAKRNSGSLTDKFLPDYFKLQTERIELVKDQHLRWNLYNSDTKTILCGIFIRYLFSALQRNCDKRSKMSFINRYNWVKNIYDTVLYKELIGFSRPDSVIVRIMSFLLKNRLTLLCLAAGRIIYIVKNKLPVVFSKIKSKR